MYLYAAMCTSVQYAWVPEECIRSHGGGDRDGCEPSKVGMLETKLGPPKELPVSLTVGLSLQPRHCFLDAAFGMYP